MIFIYTIYTIFFYLYELTYFYRIRQKYTLSRRILALNMGTKLVILLAPISFNAHVSLRICQANWLVLKKFLKMVVSVFSQMNRNEFNKYIINDLATTN